MLDILTISALLIFQTDPEKIKQEPQGLLDCGFDRRNVYICRKENYLETDSVDGRRKGIIVIKRVVEDNR